MARVTVVDYDRGNLFSVRRALEHCGAEVELTDAAPGIEAAERLILPGVGAFGDAMAGLRQRGLVEALRSYASNGRPFLGICIGMQLLFERSDEFDAGEGLGVLPGAVVAIPTEGADGSPHKVPHVGWTGIAPAADGISWQGTLLQGIEPDTPFYFVHSFTPMPEKPEHRLADGHYNGHRLSAAVRRDNVYGFQFHPEKSGEAGLDILRAFIAL